jgi:hypothetical protein
VLGIERDFDYLSKGRQSADGWLLSLQTAIINALGAEVWAAISTSLVIHNTKTVAVVYCPARIVETWHSEEDGECFYIRTSNATHELTGSGLIRYIREHWPA